MVGLNHEMSRELLWNEFPTDQRGSYFRQFWNVRGVEPPGNDDPEKLRDIREIHAVDQATRARATQRAAADAERRRAARAARARRSRSGAIPNTEVYALRRTRTRRASARSATERMTTSSTARCARRRVLRLLPDADAGGRCGGRNRRQRRSGLVLRAAGAACRAALRSRRRRRRSAAPIGDWNELSWTQPRRERGGARRHSHTSISTSSCPTSARSNTGSEPAWHADSGLGRTRRAGRAPGLHHAAAAGADRDSRVRHAARERAEL